ncbi:MAG: hypothetical protein LBJ08_00800 [Bifidobacteriaceae bacterium]|nr:hypothetical protein [Bifidobacteriaceae bacterium]
MDISDNKGLGRWHAVGLSEWQAADSLGHDWTGRDMSSAVGWSGGGVAVGPGGVRWEPTSIKG